MFHNGRRWDSFRARRLHSWRCDARGLFAERVRWHLEPFTVVFLLPIFFAFSGLNTRLESVNSAHLSGIAVVVLIAAIAGKGVACWAAARLNIGLQGGIIQSALFSIMVLMAIVTTLMASPVFELVYRRKPAVLNVPDITPINRTNGDIRS